MDILIYFWIIFLNNIYLKKLKNILISLSEILKYIYILFHTTFFKRNKSFYKKKKKWTKEDKNLIHINTKRE